MADAEIPPEEVPDIKTDTPDLEDTNMANYGSKEHRDLRTEIAKKEPAWDGCGEKAGVEIWRIEKFRVKHWPKEQYGEFYSGDSYIILHTKINDEGKKTYDVYFWLGAETTQDEAGSAAIKTVELDDYFKDEPVQFREVQGNESKGFLDLFKKLTILDGGVESGFNKVKPTEYKPRLLHITGYKKHVQVVQVPLKKESLCNSDSFILDLGLKLFQFNGKKASGWEKRKANSEVNDIKSQRHGKVKDTQIIDGLADDTAPEEFWGFFGGKPDSIPDHPAVAEEEQKNMEIEPSMWKVSDESGEMKVEKVGTLDKSKLESDDAFIIDAGARLFVWIGKGANRAEKKEAMKHAVKYLEDNGRSAKIPIARVCEGQRCPELDRVFDLAAKDWKKIATEAGGRRASAAVWRG